MWANMEEETDWFADETDGFEFCSDGRDTADVGEWDDSTAALTPTPSATSTAVTTSTPANSEKAVSGVPIAHTMHNYSCTWAGVLLGWLVGI